jgi:hypothetical protein
MKLTTIALQLYSRSQVRSHAKGPMNLGSPVVQPYKCTTVGAVGRIATRPWNISGNTLAPIANDPSGSTLTPSAMSRRGG